MPTLNTLPHRTRPQHVTARWFEKGRKRTLSATVDALNHCHALTLFERNLPAHPSLLDGYSASVSI